MLRFIPATFVAALVVVGCKSPEETTVDPTPAELPELADAAPIEPELDAPIEELEDLEDIAPIEGDPIATIDTTEEFIPLDPDDPAFLRRPYTASQIRDAWVVGFEVTMEMWADGLGSRIQTYRVVETDADGASIELTVTDPQGEAAGPPATMRRTWQEMSDETRFPSDRATVESTTSETPLGNLECWRYLQWDDASAMVAEFLFAKDLPGLPVMVEVRQDGNLVATTTQVKRSSP